MVAMPGDPQSPIEAAPEEQTKDYTSVPTQDFVEIILASCRC